MKRYLKVWNCVSRCRKAKPTPFLHPGLRKKRPGRSRLSDVLSSQMILATHNLPSGLLIERLWWTRWSYDSWCRKSTQNHFLHTGHCKKRLGRCCLSDVLSMRMALRTYKLHSGRFKKTTLVKLMKRCFKVSICHANSFSASWASKTATWTRSLIWSFK
jgi:hypothetical protein